RSARARFPVDLKNLVERLGRRRMRWRQRLMHELGDIGESDASREETSERYLIGGVEHPGRRAAGFQRLARTTARGKAFEVRLLEVQAANGGQIEALRRGFDPLRPGERMSD